MTNTNLIAAADASPEHIEFCLKRYAKRHGIKVADLRRLAKKGDLSYVQCALNEVSELGSFWHPDANGEPARN